MINAGRFNNVAVIAQTQAMEPDGDPNIRLVQNLSRKVFGIQHFTGKGLARYSFPLPPLAEQHRIVAKVDQLMALADQLETELTTRQTDSRRLLAAVLHEALQEK